MKGSKIIDEQVFRMIIRELADVGIDNSPKITTEEGEKLMRDVNGMLERMIEYIAKQVDKNLTYHEHAG